MSVKMSEYTTMGWCEDCESEHLHPGCGMTYRERLRSVRLDNSVTPTRTLKNYYDRDALDGLFSTPEDERKERYAEETEGVGAASLAEIRGHDGDVISEHFLRTHPEWEGWDGGDADVQGSGDDPGGRED